MLLYMSQKAACALELIKISPRFVRSVFSAESKVQDLQEPVCLCMMTVCFETLIPFISAVSSSPRLPPFFFLLQTN